MGVFFSNMISVVFLRTCSVKDFGSSLQFGLIDYIVFYAVSAIFRPYNGGQFGLRGQIELKIINVAVKDK